MNEYQTDQSLSIMSNIMSLSSENINPIQNILQCSLCVFATSNRYATINLLIISIIHCMYVHIGKHMYNVCQAYIVYNFLKLIYGNFKCNLYIITYSITIIVSQ